MSHPGRLIESFETPFALALRFADVPVRVRANDAPVRDELETYYRRYSGDPTEAPAAEVSLIHGHLDPGGEFVDVERGPARKVKEAVQEVPGGRLILKRTTGVIMGIWPGHAFAVGDLRTNLNQAVNLVNSCYAKTVLRRGHVLLHASGVSWQGRTVVLAGPPGAGKSTAALHLVEDGLRFLSNDRVLARPVGRGVEALGYPKQPRVNPGTLVHHPRLAALLEADDRARLAALPPDTLWDLERKRDVDLDAVYGPATVELAGEMQALVLLKWRRDGAGFTMRALSAAEGLANLPLFSKDLGVFDLDHPARAADRMSRFAEVIGRVRVVEVTGGVDFPALVDLVDTLLTR